MAAKLQVRLTFQGGEDMKRALKELGVEGEKSFGKVRTAAHGVRASLKSAGDAIGVVVKSFTVLGAAALAAGAAVLSVAKSSAEAADKVGKESEKVGVAAEAYQRLAFAAGESDVELEGLSTALIEINKAIAAGDPNKLKIFQALGIRVTDAAGKLRSADKVLLDLADVFAKVPNGAAKTAIAVALLGKAGANLIPFLNQGSDNLRKLGDEAARLGLIFSDQAIKASDEFGDTLDRLLGAIKGVKNAIGQVFIPELTRLFRALTDWIVANRAEIVAWVQAGWDTVVQVVKDLIALFQGRDADVVNTWLITARDNLNRALEVATAVANAIVGILKLFGLLEDAEVRAQKIAAKQLPQRPDGIVPRYAFGGLVGGRLGVDKNLAWLTRGEFVLRKDAVDALGVPFLSALNGGMLPAFADGGLNDGGRPLTIKIGEDSFGPMSAGEGIVNSLLRYSRRRSLRHPGRAPSWVSRT